MCALCVVDVWQSVIVQEQSIIGIAEPQSHTGKWKVGFEN